MMTDQDIVYAVNYANAIDPRIQSNQPTYDLWARVLRTYALIQVQAAVQVFYERYADPSSRPTIDAPQIRKIINHETERREAKGRAIEAEPVARNPGSYRTRNAELWDRLMREGRDQYRADLRARGITPHAETCPTCKPR